MHQCVYLCSRAAAGAAFAVAIDIRRACSHLMEIMSRKQSCVIMKTYQRARKLNRKARRLGKQPPALVVLAF
jgi:predicted amino acid racemase